MTQKQLIKEYCKRNGKIIPAKLREAERAIMGEWIGSECIRRCQEMVEAGEMYRWKNEGKFAVYSLEKPLINNQLSTLEPVIVNEKVRQWNLQFYPKPVEQRLF